MRGWLHEAFLVGFVDFVTAERCIVRWPEWLADEGFRFFIFVLWLVFWGLGAGGDLFFLGFCLGVFYLRFALFISPTPPEG